MASDRIFGLVVVISALAYLAGAFQIQTSFLSDPVGPRVFPMMIAVVGLLCGLTMLWKPDAEPEWPPLPVWLKMAVTVVILTAYAYMLAPLGFLIPTALVAAGVSYMIAPQPAKAALTGVALSVGLFVLFKYALGLGLVALPKAMMG
ncbi:tripartite tricarboxylate transporter TctB family protein [Gemmobacter lutimaris]|uniref:Tripartite tricarboxylate transporter TctB family protein n=1 Tax=Gemmobacter lutimaris TaxID=2306023 RepID=A0A398BTW0_9RHOB|nr:tripartite tricarboxylate transporter TctB family protein [Gemmobacter lutimaris]RID92371.1 tripartite tricarboxylate transporter TctB family protein [Gemmobacter lutimaris]